MNIPNMLTIFRIIMAVLFASAVNCDGLSCKIIAIILFSVASITDYFDGYIARKYNLQSALGAILDPIADKVLILIAFYSFAFMSVIEWWMFIIIAIREIGITIWRLIIMGYGKVHAAESLGKYKTVLQMVSILFILFFLILRETDYYSIWGKSVLLGWKIIIQILMYISVALTLISGVLYLLKNMRDNNVR